MGAARSPRILKPRCSRWPESVPSVRRCSVVATALNVQPTSGCAALNRRVAAPHDRRPHARVRRVSDGIGGSRRVLLIEGHRAAMATDRDDVIARALVHAGLNIELDVVRSLGSTLRVVAAHPDALDRYDAVVILSPTPSSRQYRTAVQELIAGRIADRVPTLLVKVAMPGQSAGMSGLDGAPGRGDVGSVADTLVLASGATRASVARQIAAAFQGVLDRLPERRGTLAAAAAEGVRLSYGTLDHAALARLDRIARLAQEGSGLTAAEISLLDPVRETVVTITGAGALKQARSADSLDALTMRHNAPLILSDTWLDAAASRLDVTSGPGAVRFYAAYPIRLTREEAIGALSLHDSRPQDRDAVDRELLRDLALLAEGEFIAALKRSAN